MTPTVQVTLSSQFADELPELALPWQAAEAPAPQLLVLNEALAEELGLDPEQLRTPEGVDLLLGRRLPEGARPVAQGYAGHQFGGYTPRLGDGRALLLGEVTTPEGEKRDLHLKGSGRTPFSRGADGYATVAAMLREHVISEAMHALSIPTTRSLAVVATGRTVRRETLQPGAVLVRVASSHLRVGTFEYVRASGQVDLLRRLSEHAMRRHTPEALSSENPALALYGEVVKRQAALVAKQMSVGFVHGVMNTDNMTISGETIDYGPCAFLDAFDPGASFSSIDEAGRYAYGNQPLVAEWNLARLAEALLPLLSDDEARAVELAVNALQEYRPQYRSAWSGELGQKLGIPGEPEDTVTELASELLALAAESSADHTQLFRALGRAARGERDPARDRVLDVARFDAWAERWTALSPDAETMEKVNPVYIPRNHLVEEALEAATRGELALLEELAQVVRRPYTEQVGRERYAEPAPGHQSTYLTYCGT